MATNTINYNLRKPAGGDFVTVAADINANMDIIDNAMKAIDTSTDARLDVLEGATIYAVKTADESVTSSVAMQNDDHLSSGTIQPGTYDVDMLLIITGDSAADFNMQMTWTGTMAVSGYQHAFPQGVTTLSDTQRVESFSDDTVSPSSQMVAGCVTGSNTFLKAQYTVIVTVAGIFRLQWAQNVSNATATKVLKGSHLKLQKVA